MFTEVAAEDLLSEVRGHDFEGDPVHECGASRIDAIVACDRLTAAAKAVQLRQVAALYAERATLMAGRGDPALSVIGEIGMARNISPSAAGTLFALAVGMTRLPKTLALLESGQISELVARAVVKESESLSVDDFDVLDGEIAPLLPGLTHVRAGHLVARAVIRIDAEAARVRAERNRADQRVSIFPDTDGVAILQIRGPAEQIVATYNILDAYGRGLHASGDERTLGQIMSQTLVERVTGRAHADTADVEVQLVMDAATLVGVDGEPVDLVGYGPGSPDIADEIIASAPNPSIRRLLVDPVDGTLLVREPNRRRFDPRTRQHIRARDRLCRQPGCDARIRDDDHIHDHALGGPTVAENGQGLCKRSHTLRHLPGWKVVSDGKATIWQTPTGHQHRANPPPLLPRDAPGHQRQ